jgi:hypothetical protein
LRALILALLGLTGLQALHAAPGDPYLPGRLSVRFFEHPVLQDGAALRFADPAFDAIVRDFPALDIEPLYEVLTRPTVPDLSLNYVLSFDEAADMESLAALFEATGKVEYAEPDYLMRLHRTPNDPSFGSQWTMSRCDVEEAWDLLPAVVPDNDDMIIAIIDSGVDWNHPDLISRIWVNPGEDLDSNGVVPSGSTPGEADERNGVDDDSNGYIDDFYGWDWVTGVAGCHPNEDCNDPDNNPMDFDGHGTHCAGIAAAATDNAIGVASIAWNARIMCLRAGYHAADGNGYVVQTAAANAINYAVANGAKLINMSFGGSGTLRTPATVAYNSGVLCFHAAGNDDVETQDQLDRATGMISVASTSSNDCKSDFSNYGEWVDISAPGSAIYSTYFNNNYASLYGTSMAAPNAVSLAALIWWMNPDLSHVEVRERLIGTADNIYGMACNSEYVGKLGSGRINAYKALMDIRETSIVLDGVEILPLGGPGRALPGDTLVVHYSVSNTGFNPTSPLSLSLSSEGDQVELLTPELTLPVLPDGATYTQSDFPVLLRIHDDAEPHYYGLQLAIDAENAPEVQAQSGEIMIGQPWILLYDDSQNEANLPVYWRQAMQANGWIFDWYRSAEAGFPDLPGESLDMDRYQWAVYASGQNASTLDGDEQALFGAFLAEGRDLLLSGQHIDEDLAGSEFFSQVLNAGTGERSNNTKRVYGVHGPLDGTSMILQGAGGADNQSVPISEIVPLEGAEALFLDNGSEFCTGLLAGWGEGRAVYLNFALEAAGGAGSSLNTGEVLAILVDHYLMGVAIADQDATRPVAHRLTAPWPNPFNPATQLAFELARTARVELTVYNLLGQPVARLAEGRLPAGEHRRLFEAGALPSGLYLAHLAVDGAPVATEKLMLVR